MSNAYEFKLALTVLPALAYQQQSKAMKCIASRSHRTEEMTPIHTGIVLCSKTVYANAGPCNIQI
jgi:hypothetical protein